MRLLLSFYLFLFSVTISEAQIITVVDKESEEPIFNVAVFNKDKSKSVLTDFDGKADLSDFSASEILFFRHVSHDEFHSTKKQILQNGNFVRLAPNENLLEEVVLSVSKFDQQRKRVPQKIISIKKNDVVAASPQTAADLLESTGQVYVQKSQMGGGSPMIRGFATNRLLITVDGVRMNTAIFRGGNIQNVISIDPLSIERTEVIVGPGSVIYGSDAVGGVMNFFTLSPEFSLAPGGSFSGRAYSRYATANNEKTGHFDFNYGRQKWSFLTSATFSDFGDLKMGSHGPDEYLRPDYAVRKDGQDITVTNEDPEVQVPTGYEQINLLQKIRFSPTEQWDFKLGLIYSTTTDFPRYDRLYRKRNGQLRAAEWYYGPQEWLQTNFKIDKVGNGKWYDDAKLTTAYQYFEESRHDRDYGKTTLYETKENVDAWSSNLDFEKSFGLKTLFYGIEYVLNKVGSTGTEKDIITGKVTPGISRYPDNSSWQSLAAYTSLQWELEPDLTLQTGARYNHFILQAKFDEDVYDFPFQDANLNTGALTGSAGLTWQQNSIFGWQLNLASAFRAPNIDDIGKIFDSAPGMVVVPNPNLKPETAYNAELGSKLNFGDVVRFEAVGFYTYLDNALVRRDFDLDGQTIIDYQGEPSRVQAIQNSASARVYGLELATLVNILEDVVLTAHANWTKGEEEQEDGTTAPLRHAAPFFGNAHLVWQKGEFKFDLFGEYNAEVAFEDLAPSEKDKAYLYAVDAGGNPYSPEWYTLNITGQYKFDDNWLATASLENITGQRYRTYSSGIAAAGRNLILALQYTF